MVHGSVPCGNGDALCDLLVSVPCAFACFCTPHARQEIQRQSSTIRLGGGAFTTELINESNIHTLAHCRSAASCGRDQEQ
eukprot:scaffold12971_cov68-Cyclotella_meneghiniana.AAC.2